jgi:UDP-glucose:(heptosyl)LPS alpha-1,3-glucosyltransferase
VQRLAIIRQSYRPDGGAERIIQRMIDGLQQYYPLDITLITQQWQGVSSNIQLLKVPQQGWTRTQRFNSFVQNTQHILSQHTFDWIQSHERVPGCQIYRAGDGVHAEWLRIRGEHLGFLGRWWQAKDSFHQAVLNAEKEFFAHPSLKAVICNSEQVRQEILKHYPNVHSNSLHLVRNGVDLEHFTPPTVAEKQLARKQLGLRKTTPTLLFVGSGFDRKGLPQLLQALVRVPHWTLLVVGQDKHLKNYKKVCLQWGLSHRIRFLGVLKDVRPVYQAADVLVHPAWYDPAPNVILEAMAMGLPVVTTNTCGNSELIINGHNGFVVAHNQHKALTDVLSQSLDWSTLGLSARQQVEPYTIERMINDLVAVYQNVIC